jgi:hypothetical protein
MCKRLRSPGINSKESIPAAYVAWRAGTATLFVVSARQPTLAVEIDSLESIPGLHKCLKIRARAHTQLINDDQGYQFYVKSCSNSEGLAMFSVGGGRECTQRHIGLSFR